MAPVHVSSRGEAGWILRVVCRAEYRRIVDAHEAIAEWSYNAGGPPARHGIVLGVRTNQAEKTLRIEFSGERIYRLGTFRQTEILAHSLPIEIIRTVVREEGR